MSELLLEILSEEIPARMQARAADDLKRLVGDGLKNAGLSFDRAESYATPRRLSLIIDGLPESQPDVTEERRGPRIDAPQAAIEGFLRSTGLTLSQCESRKTEKGEFYFAVVHRKGKPTTHVALDVIGPTIWSFPWSKSMRWRSSRATWVRPLQQIALLFNGKPIEGSIDFEGGVSVNFGGMTVGHRFLAPKRFKVRAFADYKKKLRAAKVILDPAERRQIIVEKSEKLAAAKGLELIPDGALLDEVVGLVEWPVPLLGAIDAQFMDLPPEVLTTAMRRHQKYFALRDGKGALASNFILVANTETKDKGKAVVAGNERVLRARLSDARFFWDQDRKASLESRVPKLGERVFHAKLGTDLERSKRLVRLARALAPRIPGCDPAHAERAALLCKADLTTGMVGEFPELQGVMGRYYARHDGETPEVATAIAEHYSPLGPSDACPKAPLSVAVALADKIDTLVGFFAIGEKPTGSKDPFALRRAALGVIRLIVENRLRLPLIDVFDIADAHFAKASAPQGGLRPNELLDFFADRVKVVLRDKGVRHDLIDAVFAAEKTGGGREDDLVRLLARVEALERFLRGEDGANLLVAYRRAANILRIEEKKDGRSYAGAADPSLLAQEEERTLHAALDQAAQRTPAALAGERFDEAMSVLANLRAPVDAFFDKVTVNCDDPALRANRLRLLSAIRSGLGGVADFSKIEG